MINASDSIVGQSYLTTSGILVEVIEKKVDTVVVKSGETGNYVPLPLSYKLNPVTNTTAAPIEIVEAVKEKAMSEETAVAPVETKVRKVKKSNIVDAGLKGNISIDEIVKNVLLAFPETLEKSVRNLISVRRSKLKQPKATV